MVHSDVFGDEWREESVIRLAVAAYIDQPASEVGFRHLVEILLEDRSNQKIVDRGCRDAEHDYKCLDLRNGSDKSEDQGFPIWFSVNRGAIWREDGVWRTT